MPTKNKSKKNPAQPLNRIENLPAIPAEPFKRDHGIVSPEALTVWEPTPGLAMASATDDALTHQVLAKYPLALSKNGRWTGKLQNIGDYCLQKTGRAFVQRQADAIFAKEQRKVEVITEQERKQLSDDYDRLRQNFYQDAKSVAALVQSRENFQMQRVAFRKTPKGVAMTTSGTLLTTQISEVETLKRQLAAKDEQIAKLEKHVPKKVATRLAKQEKAHEIDSIVTRGTVPATSTPEPVAGAAVPSTPEPATTNKA